jgi:hypothetical protein
MDQLTHSVGTTYINNYKEIKSPDKENQVGRTERLPVSLCRAPILEPFNLHFRMASWLSLKSMENAFPGMEYPKLPWKYSKLQCAGWFSESLASCELPYRSCSEHSHRRKMAQTRALMNAYMSKFKTRLSNAHLVDFEE